MFSAKCASPRWPCSLLLRFRHGAPRALLSPNCRATPSLSEVHRLCAHTPRFLSASTRILSGKPPRAMWRAAVLLGLYRIRASLIADISLALFYVAGEGGAASAGVSRLDRVTVKCWPNTTVLEIRGNRDLPWRVVTAVYFRCRCSCALSRSRMTP